MAREAHLGNTVCIFSLDTHHRGPHSYQQQLILQQVAWGWSLLTVKTSVKAWSLLVGALCMVCVGSYL